MNILFLKSEKSIKTTIPNAQIFLKCCQAKENIFLPISKKNKTVLEFFCEVFFLQFMKRIKKEKNVLSTYFKQKKTKNRQFWMALFFSHLQNDLLKKKRILLKYFWEKSFYFKNNSCFPPSLFQSSKKKVLGVVERTNFLFIQQNLKTKSFFQKKTNQNPYSSIDWKYLFEQKIKFLCIDFFEEIFFSFVFVKNFFQKQHNHFSCFQTFSQKFFSTMILQNEKSVQIKKKRNCSNRKYISWQNFFRIFSKIISSFLYMLFLKIFSIKFSHLSFFHKKNFEKISQKLKQFFSYSLTLQWSENSYFFFKNMNFQNTMVQHSFFNFSQKYLKNSTPGSPDSLQNNSFSFKLFKQKKIFCLFDSSLIDFFGIRWNLFENQHVVYKMWKTQNIFCFSTFFLNSLNNFSSPIFFHCQKMEKFKNTINNHKTKIFVCTDSFVFFQNFPLSLEVLIKESRLLTFEFFFFSFFQNLFVENLNFLFFQNEFKVFQDFFENRFVFQNSLQIVVNNLFFKNAQNQIVETMRTIPFTLMNKQISKNKKFFVNCEKNVYCFFHQIHQKNDKTLSFHWEQKKFFASSVCSQIKPLVLKNQLFFSQQKFNPQLSFFFKKTDWYIPLHILFFSVLKTTEFKKIPLFFVIFLFSFFEKKDIFQKKQKKIKKNEYFCFEKTQQYFWKNFLGFKFFDLFLFFRLKYEKNIKNIFFFKTKPTRESIFSHLHECKQILKHSIASPQFKIMKKLQKKINFWCHQYDKSFPTKKIFFYCDGILLKFLWNWAKRKHPKKSKDWIRKKYFYFISNNKWFFAQKIGNQFVCLQLHVNNKKKE